MLRGEVWRINLDPTVGAEIRKTRPVIIVNDDEIGILPLKVVVPITDWKDRYENTVWMTKVEPSRKTVCLKPRLPMLFNCVPFHRKDLSKKSVRFPTRILKKSPNLWRLS
jgi:hypothetical protein